MNPDIQFLQKQIDDLQKKINQFSNSSTIDRNVETAFGERLTSTFMAPSGTGVAGTQNKAINTTPTVITVPAQPSGTLTVVFKGTTYNLLYA